MISDTLSPNEYNPYYKPYIDMASNKSIIKGLEQNLISISSLYSKIPVEKLDWAYAKGKWTIKDILLHCIDVERIFAYRALRIARKDETPLAGFDQDDYVLSANSTKRPIESLLEEFKAVRDATITLFKSFDNDSLMQIGQASGSPISVRAIGYIITGHENHHVNIINERYL
ncbi:DinB family protein [Winogradskyella flava]|uniref:DinB family protein n=1 Tax=Winogradskyella flava TaxID=1884876 RepID=A0A842IT94_9FLAO|nr:DinB family protein [Winogradskyella flava]MBC2844973.1 DinB family protein [Winogradskyella flava]